VIGTGKQSYGGLSAWAAISVGAAKTAMEGARRARRNFMMGREDF
jgi:hypothetical protein